LFLGMPPRQGRSMLLTYIAMLPQFIRAINSHAAAN
jgi:hypothetical protein